MAAYLIASIVFANLAIGLIGIPLYIKAACFVNILDIPNERSSHTKPTPRGGGIFVAVGTILTIVITTQALDLTAPPWGLIISFIIIATIGFIDDLHEVHSLIRLPIQLFCSTWIAIQYIETGGTANNITTMALVAVWLTSCLNIYNFMDGIDGIATLQGIIASLSWGIIAYNTNDQYTLLINLLLFGGLLAFLRYNWPPAKIFMGDCASSFLGFAFAALPLLHSNDTGADLWQSINLSALMLFPFLFDGTYTLFRRLSKRENILKAHRSHLYQRWTQSGASHKYVSTRYGLWAAIGGAAALLVHFDLISLLPAYFLVLAPASALLIHSRKFPS